MQEIPVWLVRSPVSAVRAVLLKFHFTTKEAAEAFIQQSQTTTRLELVESSLIIYETAEECLKNEHFI